MSLFQELNVSDGGGDGVCKIKRPGSPCAEDKMSKRLKDGEEVKRSFLEEGGS